MPDYKHKVRVRACGLLVENHKLLLAELLSPITGEVIWTPPGGGVEFGEKLQDTVKREFIEETGLTIQVKELLHINELIQEDFHAIEFFYRVKLLSGTLVLGADPEYSKEDQILKNLAFKSKEEIKAIKITPDYLKAEFWKEMELD